MAEKVLNVKLVKSAIGENPVQRATLEGLGLRRLNQVVSRKDSRALRGMLTRVTHLVRLVRNVPVCKSESSESYKIIKNSNKGQQDSDAGGKKTR